MDLVKFITSISLLEWSGYLATVLCITSLMMSDIKKLRWLNLISSVIFAVYSVLKQAYPVAVTNSLIIVVDIYYIFKIYQAEIKAKAQVNEVKKEKAAV